MGQLCSCFVGDGALAYEMFSYVLGPQKVRKTPCAMSMASTLANESTPRTQDSYIIDRTQCKMKTWDPLSKH